MTASFDFRDPDHVTAGAVGPPGQRVFYLQAREGTEVVSLRLEKQQVAALCDYLSGILNDLAPVAESVPADLELIEPIVPEWVIGALAVAYEEAEDRILLVAEEFIPPPADADEQAARVFLDEVETSSARFRLTRVQVKAMVQHAMQVVVAGRAICQICGGPMDPAGHICPRNN